MKQLFFITFLLIAGFATAQPAKPKPRPAAKPAAAPKVVASIANLNGGNIPLSVAQSLLDSALVVRDEKGNRYPLYKFTFMYRRTNTFKDEFTEQEQTAYEWLSIDLTNNKQLDELWRNSVKETLQPGEEIYFEKIIADSKKGFLLPAKSIKFTITK
jgi:hypothetical protein